MFYLRRSRKDFEAKLDVAGRASLLHIRSRVFDVGMVTSYLGIRGVADFQSPSRFAIFGAKARELAQESTGRRSGAGEDPQAAQFGRLHRHHRAPASYVVSATDKDGKGILLLVGPSWSTKLHEEEPATVKSPPGRDDLIQQ